MSRPSHVLGIDPGLQGALCLMDSSTRGITSICDMPITNGRVDPAKLAQIVDQMQFQSNRDLHAAVELVSSMPRQSGAFNFGVSAGVIHGVLGALGVPFTLVPPGQWKPAIGLRRLPNETQAQNKTRARELASRLWPEHAADFAKVKFDGRAEAALLARFWASDKQ